MTHGAFLGLLHGPGTSATIRCMGTGWRPPAPFPVATWAVLPCSAAGLAADPPAEMRWWPLDKQPLAFLCTDQSEMQRDAGRRKASRDKPQNVSFLQEVNDCFLELFQSYLYFQSVGSNGLTYQVGHLPDTPGQALGSWAVWPSWEHWADGTGQGRGLCSWGCHWPPLGDRSKSLPMDAKLLGEGSLSS